VTRFRPPVRRARSGSYTLHLDDDEIGLVRRLLAELRALLTADPAEADAITTRLFPTVHPDDPEQEAEYQRLMRDELVTSRLAALDTVDAALVSGERLDEAQLTAFMQSLNAVRLVLGTMLDVGDDPDDDEVSSELADSAEHHLYGYLSWLLEWTVRAMSGA
jgi:hypothetical protein